MAERRPKYRRALPEDRRDDLVAATLRCLAKWGHAGVSVRRIAVEAGVSAGLVNHHFDGIEALVAAAYEKVARDVMAAILARVEPVSGARARLSAFIEASFSPAVLDPALLRVWVVFWSLLPHADVLKEIQKRTWVDYRRTLEVELAGCVPAGRAIDVERVALGLAALMDGLWLQWCLDPGCYAAEVGVALAERFVDDALVAARQG
jgi:AcrR family transcriptional regulator